MQKLGDALSSSIATSFRPMAEPARSITGAFVAMGWPCAAWSRQDDDGRAHPRLRCCHSIGIVDGEIMLDLSRGKRTRRVDMNVVATGSKKLIEVQARRSAVVRRRQFARCSPGAPRIES